MEYEFDVALSYAGEDRRYVEKVAYTLRSKNVKVFYDEFEVVTLWGADLHESLDSVYRTKSRYAVVFSSENYARKMWTNHERRSAQARALEEKATYLLPVRLDDADVPGLRPTIAYLDGRVRSPENVADSILVKLGSAVASTQSEHPTPSAVPQTRLEYQEIASLRPSGWQYLLLAGGAWNAFRRVEGALADHEIGYFRSINHVVVGELAGFISSRTHRLEAIVENISTLMRADNQEKAIGGADHLGDPVKIKRLTDRFGDLLQELVALVADIRGTACRSVYRPTLISLSQLADQPVTQVVGYVNRLVADVNDLVQREEFVFGRTPSVTTGLNVSINPDRMSNFRDDLRQVARNVHDELDNGRYWTWF